MTKWFICSDYCLDDKKKPNNVISFVIFPYIRDFENWNKLIENIQKTDLKHCRQIYPAFCDLVKRGDFFSFNFILDKNCLLEEWKDKAVLDNVLDYYIVMTAEWQQTTPKNTEEYKRINKELKVLRDKTRSKNFNYKLLGRIMEISFLASYLKYLLYREVENIEIFSWLSDRDAITSWNGGIYSDLYHIISHCTISEKLTPEKDNLVKEIMPQNVDSNMWYDPLNRVADIICGVIADFSYIDGSVSGSKQQKLMEEAISDNDYLIILKISEKGIARVSHKKI